MKKTKKILPLALALTLTATSVPFNVLADTATRPADGVTEEQPFLSGTGESECFRIPCFVTLNDGTLVAGCDARWNTWGDGGGLDTIVSYSKDNGATWNYTFANYLGDNGNVWNGASTAFIDPAMATDGEKVYMVADLFPAGYALNSANKSPETGDGFDANGNVRLSGDGRETYGYYLEKIEGAADDAESYYTIKENETDKEVEGYTVDAFFNIKGEDLDSNLFFEDSPFKPFPTDYLYLTESEDAGATWSVPSLINVKRSDEQTLLVGPGRGIVTSSGRIVFTVYEFTKSKGGDVNSAVIYSDDGGKTWERGESVKEQTSEAVATEADGSLYMFTRHGGYYISEDEGETWSEKQEMNISYNLRTQLSAITYSKKIDGRTAILLSAPTINDWDRAAGKIFVGLVQDDKTIDWAYEYSINGDDYYAYSCLDEIKSGEQAGTVGLLYESFDTAITYKNIEISDIAKGASVGEVWCTDDDGAVVNSLIMKPSEEVVLNVAGEGVSVSSDNEQVTAVYKDGQVTIQAAKSVSGLVQAVITLTDGTDTTEIPVILTAEENYEIVDLRMGDKTTYTVDGDYSHAKLDSLDTDVASVELTSEGGSQESQTLAQLATGAAKFDGEQVNVDDCRYTFTGKDNQFVISSETPDGTAVYLHPKEGDNVPNKTKESTITVTKRDSDGKFSFQDTIPPSGNGGWLWFWNDNTTKLHFDRNSSAAENCYFELFEKSAEAGNDAAIAGYVKVDEVKDGGQYLIATKAKDNSYYVLNPDAGATNYKHVVKVTGEVTAPAALDLQAQTATAIAKFDGDLMNVKDCLYTFDAKDAANQYTISAETADGTKVYLRQRTSAGLPNQADETAVNEVTKSGDTFSLKDVGSGNGGAVLYFWRDIAKLHFDKNSSADANCQFELFEPSEEAPEDSPIAGFAKVTEITDGGQYLITAKVGEDYYMLRPVLSKNKFDHVVKVTDQYASADATTDIAITGVGEGKTSVTIGGVTYFINVKNDVKNVELKVGDTYVAAGELLKADESQTVVALDKNTTLPPYEKVTKITSGDYVIGNATHIILNSASETGNPDGLGMAGADFKKTDLSNNVWKVTEAEGGYTIQDADGKYININGQNVTLSDNAQTLKIGNRSLGNFEVSAGGNYLNNWAGKNNKVAAYASSDNDWNFYQPAESMVITAQEAGTTSIVIGGTTYHITVSADQEECTHGKTKLQGEKAATCTEKGYTGDKVCSVCGKVLEKGTEIAALGHQTEVQGAKDATCTEEGYTGDKVCTVCDKVVEKGETIAALGHELGEWTIVKEPTEKEEGLKERVCTHEGCTYRETEVIEKLPAAPDKIDKAEAQKYYDSCAAYYKEADYTADSWKVYADAMKGLKAALATEDISVDDLQAAVDAVADAADGLVKKQTVPPTEQPTQKPDAQQPDSTDKDSKTPATGDPVSTTGVLAMLLGSAMTLFKRKKDEE